MKVVPLLVLSLILVGRVVAIDLEKFTARNDPNTFGVDFSIGRPKSWVPRPPNSGAVVAAFWETPQRLCDSMSLVVPKGQNLNKRDVTKNEFRPIFEDPQLEQVIGQMLPGSTFIRKQYLADYKFPAGFIDYSLTLKLPDGEHHLRVRNYLVYLRKVMLQVQFYLVQDAEPDRLTLFAKEMEQIVNSLELLPAER
jgi:hypothetical protein